MAAPPAACATGLVAAVATPPSPWGPADANLPLRYVTPRDVRPNLKETTMGLGDLTKKASDALSSEKAEEISDTVLDKAGTAAKKVTGGKFDSQIDSAIQAADKAVGTD